MTNDNKDKEFPGLFREFLFKISARNADTANMGKQNGVLKPCSLLIRKLGVLNNSQKNNFLVSDSING